MNFELNTLFKFQETIVEMQSVCVGIVDPKIRDVAVKRIDTLLEIYKAFDRFYYHSHFNDQKVLKLQHELYQAGIEVDRLKKENEKLLDSAQWPKAT